MNYDKLKKLKRDSAFICGLIDVLRLTFHGQRFLSSQHPERNKINIE